MGRIGGRCSLTEYIKVIETGEGGRAGSEYRRYEAEVTMLRERDRGVVRNIF